HPKNLVALPRRECEDLSVCSQGLRASRLTPGCDPSTPPAWKLYPGNYETLHSMTELASIFNRERYVYLGPLLKEPNLTLRYRYACKLADQYPGPVDRDPVPCAFSRYCDIMTDRLLAELLPTVERATGSQLFPTYSYLRVHRKGDILPLHKDRPSCEVSLTI